MFLSIMCLTKLLLFIILLCVQVPPGCAGINCGSNATCYIPPSDPNLVACKCSQNHLPISGQWQLGEGCEPGNVFLSF